MAKARSGPSIISSYRTMAIHAAVNSLRVIAISIGREYPRGQSAGAEEAIVLTYIRSRCLSARSVGQDQPDRDAQHVWDAA